MPVSRAVPDDHAASGPRGATRLTHGEAVLRESMQLKPVAATLNVVPHGEV